MVVRVIEISAASCWACRKRLSCSWSEQTARPDAFPAGITSASLPQKRYELSC